MSKARGKRRTRAIFINNISKAGQKLSLSAIKVSNEKLVKLIEKVYNKSFWIEDIENIKD
jgi:hypothetical protein